MWVMKTTGLWWLVAPTACPSAVGLAGLTAGSYNLWRYGPLAHSGDRRRSCQKSNLPSGARVVWFASSRSAQPSLPVVARSISGLAELRSVEFVGTCRTWHLWLGLIWATSGVKETSVIESVEPGSWVLI